MNEYRQRAVRLISAMKTILLTLSLAMAGAGTAHAQVFQPATTSGAVLGAIAGGLIGGHNHDRWGEGMVIGAVAGAVLGSVMSPPQPVYQSGTIYQTTQPTVVYGQQAPTVQSAPVAPVAPTVSTAPTIIQQGPPRSFTSRVPRAWSTWIHSPGSFISHRRRW